jgi:hypothetical protein
MTTETSTTPVNSTTSTDRREVTVSWHEEEIAFRAFLDENMSGQNEVKDSIVEILAAIRNPLRDPTAPIFSVLMCGPSTSGKTLGFKLLVQWVHGDREKMMFFSGSDFEERHQVQKLIGAPHGYHGYVSKSDPKYVAPQPGEMDESAMLAQHNLDNSKLGSKEDVVFMLFDEWEKFHSAFNRFMLRPLREGHGALNNGQPVNFRNVVIGFTSNIGSDELEKLARPMGFVTTREAKVTTKDDVRQVVVRELVKGYPPEFRNRINRVLFFAGLTGAELEVVVDMELKTLSARIIANLGGKAFILSLDSSAKQWLLVRDGSSEEKSALPGMQQKMNQFVTLPLGRMVRNGIIHAGDRVEVTHVEGEDNLRFFITADPLAHLAQKADIVDEPVMEKAKVEDGNTATGTPAGTPAGANGVSQALAVIPSSAKGGNTEAPSTDGIEVRHLQPFQLIMRSSPERLEVTSGAVRGAANALAHTMVVEYTHNLVSGIGTVDVHSTLEEMVLLRSMFPGLRVIIVGGEIGG